MNDTTEKFFGQDVLMRPTEDMMILAASEYEKERGNEFAISTTSNGWQWTTTNAFDRETLVALHAALGDLIYLTKDAEIVE